MYSDDNEMLFKVKLRLVSLTLSRFVEAGPFCRLQCRHEILLVPTICFMCSIPVNHRDGSI